MEGDSDSVQKENKTSKIMILTDPMRNPELSLGYLSVIVDS